MGSNGNNGGFNNGNIGGFANGNGNGGSNGNLNGGQGISSGVDFSSSFGISGSLGASGNLGASGSIGSTSGVGSSGSFGGSSATGTAGGSHLGGPEFEYVPSLDDQEGLHVVLKDHVVGELSLGESKAGLEVLLEKEGLLVGLDSSKHLFVDSGLISLPLVRGLVLLLLGVKDVATLLALLGLNAGTVGVVNVLGDLDAGDINLGLGGDDEALIDSAHGTAVERHGPGHDQEPGGQLLQDNDVLTLVDASENNGDNSWSNGCPQLPGVALEAAGGGPLGSRSSGGVVVGQLLNANHPGSAVLGTANLLLNEAGDGLRGLLGSLLLDELVDGLLVVHAGAAKPPC